MLVDPLQRNLATLSDPHHCDRFLALCSRPRQASYACHGLHFCTHIARKFSVLLIAHCPHPS